MFRPITVARRPCRVDLADEPMINAHRESQRMERDLCCCRTLLFRIKRGTLRPSDHHEIDRQLNLHRQHRRDDIRAEIKQYEIELNSLNNLQHQLRDTTKLLEKRPRLVSELARLKSLNLESDDILDRDL